MFTGSIRFGLERADISSPSPSPPSSLASVSFLFPPLEKENFVSLLPPSRPFPGRLFLSALLYCLKGFLLPGFPPNLVPVESGQNETPQSQKYFDVMKLGSIVVKDALPFPFPFCMNFFPFLGEKGFFDWVSILMCVWERKWDKSRKLNKSHTHSWQIKVKKRKKERMERQSPTSGYLGWNLLAMESVACDQYLFHTHQTTEWPVMLSHSGCIQQET